LERPEHGVAQVDVAQVKHVIDHVEVVRFDARGGPYADLLVSGLFDPPLQRLGRGRKGGRAVPARPRAAGSTSARAKIWVVLRLGLEPIMCGKGQSTRTDTTALVEADSVAIAPRPDLLRNAMPKRPTSASRGELVELSA
jgi:hypothetical protein